MNNATALSLDMLQNGLLFVAEKITAACLRLDPGTRARLQELNGKCIAFHLRDQIPWYSGGVTVFVLPTLKGIELSADRTYVADAAISLYARDILPMLRSGEVPAHLQAEGDETLLLQILDVVKRIDLDWEQAISPLTGDVMAHQIGNRVRETGHWVSNSLREARRLTEEYMQEELPAARQSSAFKPLFEGMEKFRAMGSSLRDGWNKK